MRDPTAPWTGGWQTLHGSEGADAITLGDAGGDLNGFGGDDAIVGGAGVEWVNGGAGDDYVEGGNPDQITAVPWVFDRDGEWMRGDAANNRNGGRAA